MLQLSLLPPTASKTIRLKSFHGTEWHSVSLDDKTCDCPEFQKSWRGCEHLSALGIHRLKPFKPTTHPTFSQALSGLVKSLRVRRVEDAVYWLTYLHGFKEKQHRFRTARRLLIGSVEDGLSIRVMEQVRDKFSEIGKPDSELLHWVAEAVRICKLPNWWHPESGGPDYIYQSLVGERAWRYKAWDHKLPTLQNEIQKAIEEKDRALALGGVTAFGTVQEAFGATKQAQFLLQLAENTGNDLAARLCNLHLSAKTALSSDNNFLCMATWMMAGGVSHVAETILPVSVGECYALLEQARHQWQNPQPIPRWCCDGIHCAGDDPRFMGCLPEMYAVCKAFEHYGRVHPDDEWLPDFQCYDGLVILRSKASATECIKPAL